MITIDGSEGEGGGQILRTSLALAALTGRPFRIRAIRAGRARPGLLRQHLTAVRAAAELCDAELSGAEIGSQELTFAPGRVRAGDLSFSIGTAGSAPLVLQTVLPPLMLAGAPSRVAVEGGTHNPSSPPHAHLDRVFLPLLERMGPTVALGLERWGFYPAGGGRIVAEIAPVAALRPLELLERGEVRAIRVRAVVAGSLPLSIGHREAVPLCDALGVDRSAAEVTHVGGPGPGNVVWAEVACEHATEVFTGFGEKGVSAEAVAAQVAREAKAWLDADVPVGEHTADQLLIPLALAGGGRFRTTAPTPHTRTNAEVVARFVEVAIAFEEGPRGWTVTVR